LDDGNYPFWTLRPMRMESTRKRELL